MMVNASVIYFSSSSLSIECMDSSFSILFSGHACLLLWLDWIFSLSIIWMHFLTFFILFSCMFIPFLLNEYCNIDQNHAFSFHSFFSSTILPQNNAACMCILYNLPPCRALARWVVQDIFNFVDFYFLLFSSCLPC